MFAIRFATLRWVTVLLCCTLLVSSVPPGSVSDAALSPTLQAPMVDWLPVSATLPPAAPEAGTGLAGSLDKGVVAGLVVNAGNAAALAGVQVMATGQAEAGPQGALLYLPLILARPAAGVAARASPAIASVGETITITTTTATNGWFELPLPAGTFTLTFSLAGFTLDRRKTTVRANETDQVETVRLHTLDANAAPIGAAGGTVSNSLNNTSLQFPAGAVATTQQVRVTYLPNGELPGFFANGSAPMGFANLEPEGLIFPSGKEVLWTVVYTGSLPVGTDTLCYWWDGITGTWRDPVPGKVVDLGSGQKALQARVHHFSAYGHALPAVEGISPGSDLPAGTLANAGRGPDQTDCLGCLINVGTGSVSESYVFPVVAGRGFPAVLALRYSTVNDTPQVTARVPFTITSQWPARAEWRIEFQGKTYTGTGYDAQATWDTRNALGYRVAPGSYPFTAVETFYYDSGAQPSLSVNGTVEVRRGDVWPFGFNWISSYDTLLVDRSETVTIVQGDGEYLTYTRQADGAYSPPAGDASTLVKQADGSWLLTSKYGGKETFNTLGRLTRLEDRNGNAHTMAYEPNGVALPAGVWGITTRPTGITDASGRTWVYTYGADGFVSRVTDPTGRQYQLAHDATGNLTTITDPLGRVTAYQYDAAHLLTAVTYPRNNKTILTYDAAGRLASHSNPLAGTMTATYGSGASSFTDPRGNSTGYKVNSYGAITQAANTVRTRSYSFDSARRLTASDPPDRRYVYDARGNLTSITGVTTVSAVYESTFNQPVSITDAAGNITGYTYDAHGNLVGITDALGNLTGLAYDAAGQLTKITDALNHMWQFGRNAYGAISSVTDPLGSQATLVYDTAGRLQSATDAETHTVSYTYDAADRLLTVVDALGRTTSYQYDANNNLKQVTDARGGITAYAYDAMDRVTVVTDPLSKQTTYTYDGAGNLASRTDAAGRTVQYNYDAVNRLTAALYSGGATAAYSYDRTNRLTGYLDAGVQVTRTYETGLARPDTVTTRLLGPRIGSTVTYDYAVAGSTAAVLAASDAASDQGPLPHPARPDGGAAFPGQEVQVAPADTLPDRAPDAPPDIGREINPGPPATPLADPRRSESPVSPGPDSPQAAGPYEEQLNGETTNVCGTISVDTTWTAAASPYLLTCDVTVASGYRLTIEPGVVVKFKSWYETLWVNGTLIADGTSAQSIYFTSYKDDTVGGDTNLDGNATTPAPDDWDSVRFASSSTGNIMDYTVVRYGGGQSGDNVNVYAATTDITFTNNTVARSSGDGMKLDNALPAVLTGNTFLNNGGGAVYAPLTNNSQSITLSGNTASGNPSGNAFLVQGTVSGTPTWDGDDSFPFEVWEDLTVNAGARLTLAPRTVLKFHDWYDTLLVNGTLIADADAANPIYFTSFRDDAVGGDTNNDGTASGPAPDDWDSVRFASSSTGSIMDYTVVRYGGGQNAENIWVESAGLALTNSTIAFSQDIGLSVRAAALALTGNTFTGNIRGIYTYDSASPVLRRNRIAGNRDWGLQNASSGMVIDAQENWWGSPTGPHDSSDDRASGGLYNPGGKGDKVSDRVDYDPWQRITGLRHGVTISTAGSPQQAISYSYDALNRVVGLTASGPASFVQQYTYDAANRLTVSGPASGQPGVQTTFTYDAANRITRMINRNPAGSVTFNDLQYTYDKIGNVQSVVDGSGATSYTYDALYQLTGVTAPGLSETYTYDADGNRLTKGSVSYTYNIANQLASASDGTTYTYDAAGNLRTRVKTGQTTTFTWDANERLTRIDFPDATYAAYVYDDLGHRISKRDRAGVMTYYIYDGMNLVQEVDASGGVTASYVHDRLDRPISMVRGGVTYYYLFDRLGNVAGLTDGAGTLVASYRYDPWGNIIATSGSNPALANPFRFLGREWDGESGLYYLRARYYDPASGRFISRDPVAGRLTSPRSLNPYLYALNNPTTLTDRTGEIVVEVVVAGTLVAMFIGGTIYVLAGMGGRARTDVEGVRVIKLQSEEGQQFVKSVEFVGATGGVVQQGLPGPSSEVTSGLEVAKIVPGGTEKLTMQAESTLINAAQSGADMEAPQASANSECQRPPQPPPESMSRRTLRWLGERFTNFGQALYNILD